MSQLLLPHYLERHPRDGFDSEYALGPGAKVPVPVFAMDSDGLDIARGNRVSISGNSGFVPDRRGYVYEKDQREDKLTLDTKIRVGCLSAWVRFDAESSYDMIAGENGLNVWLGYRHGAGFDRIELYTSNSRLQYWYYTLTVGEWYHIVLNLNIDDVASCIINGKRQPGTRDMGAPFYVDILGHYNGEGSLGLRGAMSDVAIFASSLSLAEARLVFESQRNGGPGAIAKTSRPQYLPAAVAQPPQTQTLLPHERPEVDNRLNENWELKQGDSLWTGCELFLGGKGGERRAIDSSGRGNAGTLVDDTAWTCGLGRRAWLFDGTGDLLAIPRIMPTVSQFDGNPPCTMACWFRSDGESGTGATNFNTLFGATSSNRYLYRTTDGTFLINNGQTTTTTATVRNGEWGHLVVQTDRENALTRVYVNGQLAAETIGVPWNPFGHSWNLGSYDETNYMMNGAICDAGVWSRFLVDAEIKQLASERPSLDGAIVNRSRRFLPGPTPTPAGDLSGSASITFTTSGDLVQDEDLSGSTSIVFVAFGRWSTAVTYCYPTITLDQYTGLTLEEYTIMLLVGCYDGQACAIQELYISQCRSVSAYYSAPEEAKGETFSASSGSVSSLWGKQ